MTNTQSRAATVRALLAKLTEQGYAGSAYHSSLTRELAGLERLNNPERLTYCPLGQHGGYDMYDSLSDLLTEGFPADTVVEVDNGYDVVTTTIGELLEGM